jgi:hypothetical protein
VKFKLFRVGDPIGIIPSLAPHLSRDVKLNPKFDFEKNCKVLLGLVGSGVNLREKVEEALGGEGKDMIDYELSFFDSNPVKRVGIGRKVISGRGLSNLAVPLIALRSFVGVTPGKGLNAIAFFDDGFGGGGWTSAGSNLLKSVFRRIGAPEGFFQRVSFVGADAWDTDGVFVDGKSEVVKGALGFATGVKTSDARSRGAPEIDRVVGEALGIQTIRAGVGISGRFSARERLRIEDAATSSQFFDGLFGK